MANLNMITICKAYIEKEKQREKFAPSQDEEIVEEHDVENSLSFRNKKMYRFVDRLDLLLALLAAVVIIYDYEKMSVKTERTAAILDFYVTWICLVVIILKTGILGRKIFSASFIFLDWVTILLSVGDMIYCLGNNEDLFMPKGEIHIILRSVKFYRIIKMLYFSKNWFIFEKNILGIFVQTINTMKFFFLLLTCVILVTAFLGQNLFAFKIRFDLNNKTLDLINGRPYVSNY